MAALILQLRKERKKVLLSHGQYLKSTDARTRQAGIVAIVKEIGPLAKGKHKPFMLDLIEELYDVRPSNEDWLEYKF